MRKRRPYGRVKPVLIGVMLLMAGLAGCIGMDRTEDATADGPRTEAPQASILPEAFTMQACSEQFALFTAQESDVDAYIPEGFEPAGFDGTPVAEGTAQLVGLS